MDVRSDRLRVLGGIAALVLLFGCGGSAVLEGPEAQALFARYSGSWTLDAEASDARPELGSLAPGEGRRPPGGGEAGGFLGGGGGRGGRGGPPPGGFGGDGPPGGAAGRGRGGPPGQGAEGVRTMGGFIAERPEKLSLALTDSTFTLISQPGSVMLALPMAGKQVDQGSGATAYKAKLQWKDGMPVVERSFGGGGKGSDTFEMLSADRLMIRRTLGGGQTARELRFVYDRQVQR